MSLVRVKIAEDLGNDPVHNRPQDFEDHPTGYTLPMHGVFVMGREYDVPEELADYFIRAGWAAKIGEEVVKPDPTKPVFVQPDSIKIGVKDTNG